MVWAALGCLQCRCRAPSLYLSNVTTWYGTLTQLSIWFSLFWCRPIGITNGIYHTKIKLHDVR